MSSGYVARTCKHGINDNLDIISKSVVEDYKYGTRSIIWTYWCEEHQCYGSFMVKEDHDFGKKKTAK